jgi:integrase
MSVDKITDKLVSSLSPGQTVWDEKVKGFGVRRQRKAAVYVFKYRLEGRQRFVTIGRHGSPWTPQTARGQAVQYWAGLVDRAQREPPTGRDASQSDPTFAEFAQTYLSQYASQHKKPRTLVEDRRNLDLHILPSLGRLKLREITPADIARFHAAQHARPVNANRCLSLVSHIFAIAEKRGLRETGANPCRGLDRYPERRRERFLGPDEMRCLGSALTAAASGDLADTRVMAEALARSTREDWRVTACIRLLILTGARLGEILSLQWAWINWDRGYARLPDSKTGPKTLPLPKAALALLQDLRTNPRHDKADSKFVLPGKTKDRHFSGIQQPWQRIRAAADLKDLRLHDLRHCYASAAVANGESLFLVGAILGHRSASTTQRYAHLAIDPILEAANRTAGRLISFLGG